MIQKNLIRLIDALSYGYNLAVPDLKTGDRGIWQPKIDADGNVQETFCNDFSSYVAQAFGYLKLEGLMANDIFAFVSEPANGWVKIDGEIAQAHANNGCLVLAVWKNPNPLAHGHVCVVCPGRMAPSQSFGKDVPKCVNVGRQVFFGKRISYAFPTEPSYFVLGEMV